MCALRRKNSFELRYLESMNRVVADKFVEHVGVKIRAISLVLPDQRSRHVIEGSLHLAGQMNHTFSCDSRLNSIDYVVPLAA